MSAIYFLILMLDIVISLIVDFIRLAPCYSVDHLGLYKAICVLMGWNYSVDPVHKKAYQTLSNADAEANRGDLILWPPTIIVQNTYKSRTMDKRMA
jgi:hypothetical protein